MGVRIGHTDKIGAVLLLLLSVAIFVVTADFPQGPGETGPDFYPRVIAVLIAFFALVQFGRSLVADEQRSHDISREVAVQVTGALVLVVAYVASLPYLGFVVGTIAFLLVTMWYSGVRSIARMGVASVVLTLLLYYTFVVFLRVPLPESEYYPVRELLPGMLPGVLF